MADPIDFSILVPTCNRPSQLAVCLAAIAELDYPRSRFEVVVVDDGSDTPLDPVVEPYRAVLQIALLGQSRGGPARARNRGAEAARGRFLAFTDDDCAPAPDWLTRLAGTLGNATDHVVGGRTINALSNNTCAEASQLLLDYLHGYFNQRSTEIWFLASCNLALSAELYRAVGGFDPSFPRAAAEDRDFCDRLQRHGCRKTYARNAVVYHRHALTLPSFWRQHFGYGRGAHRFRRARVHRTGEGVRVEPFGFYSGMLLHPFKRAGLRRPLQTSILLAISQVANVAGFFYESLRRAEHP